MVLDWSLFDHGIQIIKYNGQMDKLRMNRILKKYILLSGRG